MSNLDRRISNDLYDLTETLHNAGIGISGGLLGGEFGYGGEFENDVFEMRPFWWGDCTCGHEQAECEWEDTNPHSDSCYQSELTRRGYQNDPRWPDYDPNLPSGYEPSDLATEWGLPYQGCAVHCTCDYEARRKEWVAANPHPERCPVVRPNFRHKASGVEVRWYKYIGRGMEYGDVGRKQWDRIIAECVESVTVEVDA